jgi:hypothetical protein
MKKTNPILARVVRVLREPRPSANEAALKPLLIAHHLLEDNAVVSIAMPEFARLLGVIRAFIRDYFLVQTETFGWSRVPTPCVEELEALLTEALKSASFLGEPLLTRRDAKTVAKLAAQRVVQMWPVASFFAVSMMVIRAVEEQDLPESAELRLIITWDGKDKSQPRLVLADRVHDANVYQRLWREAALLLVAQAPSPTVEKMLKAKVSWITRKRVIAGSAILDARTLLVNSYRPQAIPAQAVKYLNTALKRKAIAVRQSAHLPADVGLSTMRKYRRAGLPADANDAEIASFKEERTKSKAHHVDGFLTKRQFSKQTGFSLRKIEEALSEVEKKLDKQRPKDNAALRLDDTWQHEIKLALVSKILQKRAAK